MLQGPIHYVPPIGSWLYQRQHWLGVAFATVCTSNVLLYSKIRAKDIHPIEVGAGRGSYAPAAEIPNRL